jgi:hypothetical protein
MGVDFQADLDSLFEDETKGRLMGKLSKYFPTCKTYEKLLIFNDEKDERSLIIGNGLIRIVNEEEKENDSTNIDFCCEILNIINDIIPENSLVGDIDTNSLMVMEKENDESVQNVFNCLNKALLKNDNKKFFRTRAFSVKFDLDKCSDCQMIISQAINKDSKKRAFSISLTYKGEKIKFSDAANFNKSTFSNFNTVVIPNFDEVFNK